MDEGDLGGVFGSIYKHNDFPLGLLEHLAKEEHQRPYMGFEELSVRRCITR